uniref:MgtE domain-containing protein n=1 Tax=Macrostomum lignano TaxID=282301 RepID=A0A1I8I2S9_9PLAT
NRNEQNFTFAWATGSCWRMDRCRSRPRAAAAAAATWAASAGPLSTAPSSRRHRRTVHPPVDRGAPAPAALASPPDPATSRMQHGCRTRASTPASLSSSWPSLGLRPRNTLTATGNSRPCERSMPCNWVKRLDHVTRIAGIAKVLVQVYGLVAGDAPAIVQHSQGQRGRQQQQQPDTEADSDRHHHRVAPTVRVRPVAAAALGHADAALVEPAAADAVGRARAAAPEADFALGVAGGAAGCGVPGKPVRLFTIGVAAVVDAVAKAGDAEPTSGAPAAAGTLRMTGGLHALGAGLVDSLCRVPGLAQAAHPEQRHSFGALQRRQAQVAQLTENLQACVAEPLRVDVQHRLQLGGLPDGTAVSPQAVSLGVRKDRRRQTAGAAVGCSLAGPADSVDWQFAASPIVSGHLDRTLGQAEPAVRALLEAGRAGPDADVANLQGAVVAAHDDALARVVVRRAGVFALAIAADVSAGEAGAASTRAAAAEAVAVAAGLPASILEAGAAAAVVAAAPTGALTAVEPGRPADALASVNVQFVASVAVQLRIARHTGIGRVQPDLRAVVPQWSHRGDAVLQSLAGRFKQLVPGDAAGQVTVENLVQLAAEQHRALQDGAEAGQLQLHGIGRLANLQRVVGRLAQLVVAADSPETGQAEHAKVDAEHEQAAADLLDGVQEVGAHVAHLRVQQRCLVHEVHADVLDGEVAVSVALAGRINRSSSSGVIALASSIVPACVASVLRAAAAAGGHRHPLVGEFAQTGPEKYFSQLAPRLGHLPAPPRILAGLRDVAGLRNGAAAAPATFDLVYGHSLAAADFLLSGIGEGALLWRWTRPARRSSQPTREGSGRGQPCLHPSAMDTLDEEERLDPRVKRTIGILDTWERCHLDEIKEQKRNAEQAISDSEIGFILDRIVPDGGTAWFLVVSTWISNGITNGVGFAYGLLLSGIVDDVSSAASTSCGRNATTAAACAEAAGPSLPLLTTVGTVHNCLLYLTTPIILLHSNRVRRLSDFAFMGALLTALGLFLSALTDFRRHSGLLLMHFSVTAGLGLAIQTTLQATILSHNFNRRMSTAAGITSSGSGMFSGLLSIGVSVLNAQLGVRFSFLLLAVLSLPGLVYTQFWRANRDFLLLQKWVRTPVPLLTELLTARVLRNRRYLTLFLSVLCLYSGLFYPWMMLMECAKARLAKAQLPLVAYVYMARGFSNALLRCLVGLAAATDCIRSRLLCALPINQSLLLWGLLTLLTGLQTASLPVLFLAAGITAIGESLVITSLPTLVARLTNPADTPAGLVLMNLAFSLASLVPPTLLSIVTDSLGGNFLPAFVACCAFAVLGVLLSLTLAVRLPCGGGGGGGGGDAAGVDVGGGGAVSENERYIALDASMTATPATLGGGGGSSGGGGGAGPRRTAAAVSRAPQQPAARSDAECESRTQKPLGKGMDNKVQPMAQKQQQQQPQQQPVTIPAITGQQMQWMSQPTAVTSGCPNGLEYLTVLDQVLIKQKKEFFEMMSGIEMQNKYVVRNSMGQQVYYAKECGLRPNGGEPRSVQPAVNAVRQRELQLAVVELRNAGALAVLGGDLLDLEDMAHKVPESGLGGHRVGGENAHLVERRLRHRFGGQAAADNASNFIAHRFDLLKEFIEIAASDTCVRQCCGPQRPFELAIEDNMGNEVIHVSRPYKCMCYHQLFSCCKCCFDEVTVEAPPGVKVGKVTQVYGACQIRYNIIDERDNTVFIIDGPSYCKCYCPGDDIPFKLVAKDSGLEIGRVSKQWSNLMQEYFTDADNFGIAFPLDLDVKLKAVVLGACFLIDFMFFEQGGSVASSLRSARFCLASAESIVEPAVHNFEMAHPPGASGAPALRLLGPVKVPDSGGRVAAGGASLLLHVIGLAAAAAALGRGGACSAEKCTDASSDVSACAAGTRRCRGEPHRRRSVGWGVASKLWQARALYPECTAHLLHNRSDQESVMVTLMRLQSEALSRMQGSRWPMALAGLGKPAEHSFVQLSNISPGQFRLLGAEHQAEVLPGDEVLLGHRQAAPEANRHLAGQADGLAPQAGLQLGKHGGLAAPGRVGVELQQVDSELVVDQKVDAEDAKRVARTVAIVEEVAEHGRHGADLRVQLPLGPVAIPQPVPLVEVVVELVRKPGGDLLELAERPGLLGLHALVGEVDGQVRRGGVVGQRAEPHEARVHEDEVAQLTGCGCAHACASAGSRARRDFAISVELALVGHQRPLNVALHDDLIAGHVLKLAAGQKAEQVFPDGVTLAGTGNHNIEFVLVRFRCQVIGSCLVTSLGVAETVKGFADPVKRKKVFDQY